METCKGLFFFTHLVGKTLFCFFLLVVQTSSGGRRWGPHINHLFIETQRTDHIQNKHLNILYTVTFVHIGY